MKDGSWMEDLDIDLPISHFYDPLTNKGYSVLGVEIGQSAYDSANDLSKYGAWVWARKRLYDGLTQKDNVVREQYLGIAFQALGRLMHLVHDMAVPAHTRNDLHAPAIDVELYEAYTNSRYDKLNYSITPFPYWNISISSGAPKQLWDMDSYNGSMAYDSGYIGLSEYANANFLSKDTIFKDYPHPARDNTNFEDFGLLPITVITTPDNVNHNTFYIAGYGKQHLAALKYFGEEILSQVFPLPIKKYVLSTTLDNRVHEEYSQFLLPRAVGYSAGLLDYFFRGSIEITLPQDGVYSKTDNSGTGFKGVKLLAKNTTSSTGEDMNDGSIELVVKYRLALEDPFKNYPEDYDFKAANEYSYIVVPEATGKRSIPKDSTVELNFDLTQNPIPLYALDVYLQVVYKGKLGLENDAVAVGFKDISEPTPIDIYNDMDITCLNGSSYAAGSIDAIKQVDKNNNGIAEEWDVYAHDLKDIYLRLSPSNNPLYASPSSYNAAIPYINAGSFMRALYVLTDYTFKYNSYQGWQTKDPNDPWSHMPWTTNISSGKGIKNQTDYIEDAAICAPLEAPCTIWWYPTFLSYRNDVTWWGGGATFINRAYPQNSECSCYKGILRECP